MQAACPGIPKRVYRPKASLHIFNYVTLTPTEVLKTGLATTIDGILAYSPRTLVSITCLTRWSP
ncbi:MAG: hypothetical protein Q8P02_04110, partial [Candidatus Micrarchaeota archaeon]|nr:hypothetical protein [Candidatus Micrarchaeota archaeon]